MIIFTGYVSNDIASSLMAGPEYEHTLEGADDMPAHAKSTLSGVSLTIPITNGHLNMGNRLAASLVEEHGRASISVNTGITVEQGNW